MPAFALLVYGEDHCQTCNGSGMVPDPAEQEWNSNITRD